MGDLTGSRPGGCGGRRSAPIAAASVADLHTSGGDGKRSSKEDWLRQGVKENGSPASRDRERLDPAPDRKCDCFRGGGARGARRQLRSQASFRRADRQASLRRAVWLLSGEEVATGERETGFSDVAAEKER
ncbi:hypothetical protein TIFTF001_017059 [Ficus carica]|uniref:Uncharacterized protein n=1 Tax=Ficus carica TaxID=3494 RepID=A0AA88ATY1_FICCA|nr:hypothetical protein TIFTF001_017059 [Ficus carica]